MSEAIVELRFTVGGVEYPLFMEANNSGGLNPREWGLVKRVSGVRLGEFREAIAAGDVELIVALAAIAMQRAGRPYDLDKMLDTQGYVDVVIPTEEEEAEPGPPSDAADAAESSESSNISTLPARTGPLHSPASTESSPG